MDVPHAITPRPDTGFSNAQLGMWLFLASEVMLFGALFSGYALLRTGAPGWPHGWERLHLSSASFNTLVLIASSITMALASRNGGRDLSTVRRYCLATCGLGMSFLVVKALEWQAHLGAHELPSTDTFFATYFTLTGVHGLHVLGGVLASGWVAFTARPAAGVSPAIIGARIRMTGLYWQFVDAVWIVLFVSLYLL